MSNPFPAQFDIVLSTDIVCTFPFFDAWFNIVYFTSADFPFSLPFGVPSPPDSQVVVCMR